MSKPDPPKPPDPVATANAQTGSNRDTAITNSYLGNTDQVTPYGSVTFDVTGQGPNGVPRWTQTTTESPNQQTLRELEEQQGIELGRLGLQQTGRVGDILGQPYDPRRFDTNSVTGGPLDIAAALGDYNGDVEARTRELATRGLDDQFNRSEEALRTRLANQGINAGTDAFDHEMRSFNEGKGDAYTNAELMARSQAQSDRNQALSELLTGRGTNLSEARDQYSMDTTADLAGRQNPLNEIIALMSGVQTNPINPGQPNRPTMGNTDVAGIINGGYQNQLGAYNMQSQNWQSLLNGLSSLGSSAIAFSDARLKKDVRYAKTDAKGHRWYWFRYLWDDITKRRFGVMAQEAEKVAPRAVSQHWSGWLQVAYGAL